MTILALCISCTIFKTKVLSKEIFDINELIREVIESFEPGFIKKNISAKLSFAEDSTMVLADRDKTGRIIQNLVDNAIKFTQNNGSVEIETAFADAEKIAVSVKDEGPGISKEEQKYIFDRFYKADISRNAERSSGGLGLSIAREFVMAHGERIGVISEKGEGAKFIFTLKTVQNEDLNDDI